MEKDLQNEKGKIIPNGMHVISMTLYSLFKWSVELLISEVNSVQGWIMVDMSLLIAIATAAASVIR